ncbi:hypothetical protein D9757_008747 [Collybiopsis confluens]|uniref:Uncharacterized protein n=1 Tax=Collybiopsis confluens TaxID=2823264 RepID=A0A8H5H910_9AGAR|nr:hypothetical protein D9757_008747 [Collybiopsis confluens]
MPKIKPLKLTFKTHSLKFVLAVGADIRFSRQRWFSELLETRIREYKRRMLPRFVSALLGMVIHNRLINSSFNLCTCRSKPGEDEGGEATTSARSFYNTNTAITITHRDVNLALDPRRSRPLVRFVSVGPISEEEAKLYPGEDAGAEQSKTLASCVEPTQAKPKVWPVSAPLLLPELAKTTRDAFFIPTRPTSAPLIVPDARPLASSHPVSLEVVRAPSPTQADTSSLVSSIPPRPSASLHVMTNATSLYHNVDDSDLDSPLQSPVSPVRSFGAFPFNDGRSVQPRTLLDELLPSLMSRSPSESSLLVNFVPEEDQAENYETRSFDNSHSVEDSAETSFSLHGSVRSTASASRGGRVLSLTKAVKQKIYGSNSSRHTSSTLALSRPSLSPTSPQAPSAFQRFERVLGAGGGSSVSLASRFSPKTVNGSGSPSGKSMKALLGKAKSISKGVKRSRDDENVEPEDANDAQNRPIAGRRIKRKLLGVSFGQ